MVNIKVPRGLAAAAGPTKRRWQRSGAVTSSLQPPSLPLLYQFDLQSRSRSPCDPIWDLILTLFTSRLPTSDPAQDSRETASINV
ncbi:hypothetical protein J6590_033739 [Homalodisca vitripennis]|nr:hypothetical protein J6590_033739 [Homalodisca vitripennis]